MPFDNSRIRQIPGVIAKIIGAERVGAGLSVLTASADP
jgi:hypothetical protein